MSDRLDDVIRSLMAERYGPIPTAERESADQREQARRRQRRAELAAAAKENR